MGRKIEQAMAPHLSTSSSRCTATATTSVVAASCAATAALALSSVNTSLAFTPPTPARHANQSADFSYRCCDNPRRIGYYANASVRRPGALLFSSWGDRSEGWSGRASTEADGTGTDLGCSATTAELQGDGSLVLEGVKNIRDLGSIEGFGIVKGRIFRTGHLSQATEADAATLREVTGLRTLVDLRSATEVEQDELIHADIYRGFVNVGPPEQGTGVWEGPLWDVAMKEESNHRDDFMGTDTGKGGDSRRRYFVSLIDESIYKKGVFQRLRRRHKAAVMALAPAAILSRRCTKKARGIFLQEINAGGLVLLNELLLQYSGDGINRVLRLLASRERHPVALYCTAGKDRTGLVMALTLSVLGVPESAIVDDYAKSGAAYKQLDDKDAMVGALAQQDLDPDTFLGAPPQVMEDVLHFIRVKYGSVDTYLDSIGFDAEWRDRLRSALFTE